MDSLMLSYSGTVTTNKSTAEDSRRQSHSEGIVIVVGVSHPYFKIIPGLIIYIPVTRKARQNAV